MKIILISFLFLLTCMSKTQGQILYGTTADGGDFGGGSIYRFTPKTKDLKTVVSFQTVESEPYQSGFILASDGNLYGTTSRGGRHNAGTIISFSPLNKTYKVVHEFDFTNGALPLGSLMQANDGKLYGTTINGGSSGYGYGVIFSFDIITSSCKKLHDFDYARGAYPWGPLIQANNGKLYGTAGGGGAKGAGVIFSFDPLSSSYEGLVSFDFINGSVPQGALVQADNGKLYGVTSSGGKSSNGVIFSFDYSAAVFTKLHDFDGGLDGRHCTSGLIEAGNGKIFGVAALGGTDNTGVIFSFDPSAFVYTKVHDFDLSTGINPFGNLVLTRDGRLCGMTAAGGNSKAGVIFSFNPSTLFYRKLKDFQGPDGAGPKGGLIELNDGTLFGMTSAGGRSYIGDLGGGTLSGYGVIFSFHRATTKYIKWKDFGTNQTGSDVRVRLIQASDKKLYGVTNSGGANGAGVLFSFDPLTSNFTKLKDFDITNGSYPYGNLVEASDKKLYGMTPFGGRHKAGVIYSFDPATSEFTKLKDFENVFGHPYGSLIEANDGKLYGALSSGGRHGVGAIISFDPATSTFNKLYDFDFPYGNFPAQQLIQLSDGKLYGTTSGGGLSTNQAYIFSYDLTSRMYALVKQVSKEDGSVASLIEDTNGKLYGMTCCGSTGNMGFIISLDLTTSAYTKLYQLDFSNNTRPRGGIMRASDGKLYGTTEGEGTNQTGAIFSFDPRTLTYTRLKDFLTEDVGHLGNGLVEVMECSDKKTFYRDSDKDGFGAHADLVEACTQPNGYVENDQDCNDANAAIHPDEPEICNGFDDNCDGLVDEGLGKIYFRDFDNDGYGDHSYFIEACTQPDQFVENDNDCNDADATIYPGATEFCDGSDNDCDGLADEGLSKTYYRDEDKDGYGDANNTTNGCSQPAGHVTNNTDCKDANAAVYPGAVEICNGIDDNCDGQVDEGFPDTDRDRLPDCLDPDDDNDGVPDFSDCEPFNAKKDKVLICHKGNTICVSQNAAAAHLKHGDTKGPCSSRSISSNKQNTPTKKFSTGKDNSSNHAQYSITNFPNPFTDRTTIRYELPCDSKVSIKVFDILGRLLTTLVDGEKKAGIYTVEYSRKSTSSESLFYRMVANSKEEQFEQTNKMIKYAPRP